MTDPRCELSELYVSQCAHCRGLKLEPELVGDTFAARYDGRCLACGRTFGPGDTITAYASGYICADCGMEL